MKRINRTLRLLAVTAVALGTLLPTAPAQAVTVSVSPATQTINVGDPASIDIIVSGLTDAVGGFSFILTFSDTVVRGTAYANDPDGKMGTAPQEFSLGFTGVGLSPLDIFFVADATETEASLSASQGVSFRLATVSFTGLAAGLSPLTLSSVVLSNWDGTATLPGVTTLNGDICVVAAGTAGGCAKVPEPGTLVLLTLGMLGMGLTRRRRNS